MCAGLRVPLFNTQVMPSPPPPPENIVTEEDRRAQLTYETWLSSQNLQVTQQLKYYETEVQKLRKIRKVPQHKLPDWWKVVRLVAAHSRSRPALRSCLKIASFKFPVFAVWSQNVSEFYFFQVFRVTESVVKYSFFYYFFPNFSQISLLQVQISWDFLQYYSN